MYHIFPAGEDSRPLYNRELNIHDPRYPASDDIAMRDRSHTGRGASQHQVSLVKSEVLRDVADEVGQGEDHVPRVAGLPRLSIDLAPQTNVVRVGDAGQGDEGADR